MRILMATFSSMPFVKVSQRRRDFFVLSEIRVAIPETDFTAENGGRRWRRARWKVATQVAAFVADCSGTVELRTLFDSLHLFDDPDRPLARPGYIRNDGRG